MYNFNLIVANSIQLLRETVLRACNVSLRDLALPWRVILNVTYPLPAINVPCHCFGAFKRKPVSFALHNEINCELFVC